jgi:type II secretory pathway component HofQ
LVSCDDGETIILGGVVYDTTNSVDDQYPILGDIPLIGRLFQSKAKVSEKKNLLIFMTCRLINPDGSPVREREMRGLPPFRQ